MRWTSVAWVGCLLPVLAGCGSTRHIVPWTTSDTTAPHARRADDDSRRAASAVWHTVATHHSRPFSNEFRDGFLDGYADYRQRGAAAQAPAVPPVAYDRYKQYLGNDGHALVRDYYLGFQYGTEVGPAMGRPWATIPKPPEANAPRLASASVKPTTDVLSPPRPVPDTGKFGEPRKPSSASELPPLPAAGDEKKTALPPLPKPELPVIKPFSPDLTGGGKFAASPSPSPPDRLPIPNPPLPTDEVKPVVAPAAPEVKVSFPVLPDPTAPRPGVSSDFSVLPPPK